MTPEPSTSTTRGSSRAPATSMQRVMASKTRPAGLISFVFIIAAVAELLSMLLMTVYRYRAQGFEPSFLDISKTGNLLGALLAGSFIVLFTVLALVERGRRVGLASAAVGFATAGLALLSLGPLVTIDDRIYVFSGYILFKTIEWGYFMAVLGRRRNAAWQVALRTVGMALALILVFGALLIGTLLLSPASSTIGDTAGRDFDAAVILGAAVWSGDRPSPVFRERINTGNDLLKNGTVQFLVLTGSNAPGELSESEVAKRELLSLGADPTRIVIETRTRSTQQQIMFIRDQLLKQGWKSFVIVSDQFHLTRAIEICAFNDIDAHGVSSESPLGPQNLAMYHLRESVALVLYWMFGI